MEEVQKTKTIMICLKHKKYNFICIKKSILFSLLYAVLISFIMLLMDSIYTMSNAYFIFEFTSKEFLNKLFIFAILLSIIPKKKLRVGIYLLIVLFSFIQYAHFSYFGKNINAIEFYLMATNMGETFEALNAMLAILLTPIVIAVTGFFLLYLVDLKVASHSFKYKYGGYILLAGLLFLSTQVYYVTHIKKGGLKHSDSKLLYPTTNRHSARNFFVSANYFLFGILPKKLFSNTVNFPVLKKPTLVHSDVNRTIVLVIGESLRYDTFALHDNKLTPKLQTLKEDNNFFHKKIYSGGTMTKISVSTLINRLKYPGGLVQVSQENNCLFKLAKENKFDTYFLSAQSTSQLQIIRDMMCPKYINKLIDRDSFETYIKPSGYDEDLQNLLAKLDILKKNHFIVLQQRGSHVPYTHQYPKAYERYTPYENTALYTDNSLFELITYIKNNTKQETFILYVSDHGELLGENGKKGHGHLEKEVYEIPFLMYTNSKDSTLKEQFKHIKNHYDVSNYLLSLLGYDAELYKEEDRKMYILNADFDGFSGYGTIEFKNGIESKIEIKRY